MLTHYQKIRWMTTGAHLGFLSRRGDFLRLGHSFLFFFMNRDKLRARVAIQDLWGLKFYNVFNGTTIVGAVGEILKIMLSRLLQSAKSHDFMERGHESGQNGAQNITLLVKIVHKITIQN